MLETADALDLGRRPYTTRRTEYDRRNSEGNALNQWLRWAVVVLIAAAAGLLAPQYGTALVGFLAALAVAVLAYVKPNAALILWLIVVVFTPHWTNIHVLGIGLQPTAFGIPILLGLGWAQIFRYEPTRLSWMDVSVGAASLMVLFLSFTGEIHGVVFVRDLLALWVVAYILGRSSTPKVTSAYAVIMAAVAAWGIAEFLFGVHIFENWMPSANHTLNEIQERAGVARSEAAFGHAIAYGAALALAIPFAQQLRRHALLVQFLLAAGIIVSLSRGPLLALALTLAITAWVMASTPKLRFRYTTLTVIGGVAVYLVLTSLYSGAYSDEVTGSGSARFDQYFAARDSLHWFSSALTFFGDSITPYVNGVQIIDSTPLRLAANFGIIAAVMFLVPVLVAAWRVLSRKAGPASVALAGQIPVLLVTSFITQWQSLIFFAMGLVVSEVVAAERTDTVSQTSEATEPSHTRPRTASIDSYPHAGDGRNLRIRDRSHAQGTSAISTRRS